MKLTVVGCSGSFAGPQSPASSYLVEAAWDERPERPYRLVLDLGNGSFGTLQRFITPAEVDAVVLSHLHADHCLDMCGFYVCRKYCPGGAMPPIPVLGPRGTADRLARAYDLPLDPGMREQFDFRDLTPEPVRLGPFTIEAVPVVHPVPAYGLRLSAGGRRLAYTGDTGPCPQLTDLARDADVLLAEASFLATDDNPPDLHLTGQEAGRLAAEVGVGHLVLTHIPPWHDPAAMEAESRAEYAGTLTVARVGLSVDV